MLLGLGNDIVSVKRMKNSYQRFGKRLENRIYTTAEIKLIWERGSPCFKTLSSRWAAKEAFVKALGTGFGKGIFWKDIDLVKQQVNSYNLDKTEKLIKKINDTEILIKKNSVNSVRILLDFILGQSKKN